MNRSWSSAIFLLATARLIAAADAWSSPLDQVDPLVLERSPFGSDLAGDHDRDCMDDQAEHALASWFRPSFVFDSRENALRPEEPLTLYQAHTFRMRPGCDEAPPYVLELTYSYLFADDGGYVASPFCTVAHRGDNQNVIHLIDVDRSGTRFRLVEIANGLYHWPSDPGEIWFRRRRHPVIYLSAGKHHAFFDTSLDGGSSPYSFSGCDEGVDGLGPMVLARIEHPDAPGGRLNVGELMTHPEEHFVGDLGPYGFPGEHAWGFKMFCGGYSSGCGGAESMVNKWRW